MKYENFPIPSGEPGVSDPPATKMIGALRESGPTAEQMDVLTQKIREKLGVDSALYKMNKADVARVMEVVFDELRGLRVNGQKEYAHDDASPFRNFEAQAVEFGGTREESLLRYAKKHWDGMVAYSKGHRSQRESIKGRINDYILYMILFRAMVEEDELAEAKRARIKEAIEKGQPGPYS